MESHPNAKEKIMTERQCKVKYCIPCLKNRYGEYANEIKATGSSKKPDGHIKNQGYTFQYVDVH
jgi:hypothetical protein